ncbi:tyrosine-type recombinase/integrase [Candidiatus Paracoxiella cheracis]|uniref:tyrosine-type recombinase/integrase n=1 Tax=Candidiatus Paracoxiella cheracis TaxID=3405120 RepID=UPI003BF498EF
MTAALITVSLVNKLQPKDKRYEVRDTELKGFMVRVSPSGVKTYAVQYKRSGRVTLGQHPALKLGKARDKAKKIIGDYADGLDPKQAEAKRKGIPTLKTFLTEEYEPWVKMHNISGEEAIKTIKRHFSHLMDTPIDQIKAQDIDKWRTKKLELKSMKVNTINRTVTPLRSAITKAVEWGIIEQHGLAGLKVLKYDDTRIRYLDEEEKEKLFAALNEREHKLKVGRISANEWRKSRGYDLYPEIKDFEFADHLLPMVILALNTGVRKGELRSLKRSHINLKQSTLFVEKSKNYLARYVPLNNKATTMLETWMRQTESLNSSYLFPSPSDPSKPITTITSVLDNCV